MSFLKEATEHRRQARRALRNLTAEFASELVSELRSGDSVTVPTSDGTVVRYVVLNLSWEAALLAGSGPEIREVVRTTEPTLLRIPENSFGIAVHDPRPAIWHDDNGDGWEPVGRYLYDPEVHNSHKEMAHFAIRLANDEELMLFGSEALLVNEAFALKLREEVETMSGAIDGLLSIRTQSSQK